MERAGLVELRETHAVMTIRETVAEKKLRMVFFNTNTAPQTEATYFLELEPDQKVERFSVKIGGKPAEAELLDVEKARKIYEEIVAKKKDPAILEYYGYKLLRIRLFPIPPQSAFEVEIDTIEPLRIDSGLVRVNTLNAAPSSVTKPLARMTVSATITSTHAVKTVFSPTHAVDVVRKGAHESRLAYDKKDYVPTGPFVFYYSLDDRDIGATLLAYSELAPSGVEGDGAFMLTLTPPDDDAARLPRDIVFLLDISGSMNENKKIDQVKSALKTFLQTLTDKDRFNIVTFSTEAAAWRESLVDATVDARRAGAEYVDSIRARGGTCIEEGLKLASQPGWRNAVRIIVLLSDGLPTIGERDTNKLVATASAAGARLFTFGVGFDVNTQLLDRMAINTRGDRQYIHPNEDAAPILEAFARKIDAPVLASPQIKVDGVSELYPKQLPDIFRGGSLVVFGRFKDDKPRKLELSGEGAGKPVTRTYDLGFASDRRHAFVPRLWAIQKIDWLMDEIRLRGSSKELVDHIVEIAKKYAIVTPYTAYLMTEDQPVNAAGQVHQKVLDSNANGFTGQTEWNFSKNGQSWRGAYNNEAQVMAQNEAIGRGCDAKGMQQTLGQNRMVANRAYYKRGGSWVEAAYATQKARAIQFASDEYFQYLRDNPEARGQLALGSKVTFQHKNEWIEIH